MKGLLAILLLCFFTQASENEKIKILQTGSKDLRFGKVLIKIKSEAEKSEVTFIENNNSVEVLQNNRTLKISAKQIQELDELFVKNFIHFKYEEPRVNKISCNKSYTLFLRGDDTVICKDETSKIVKIKQYIKQLNRI